MALTKEFVDQLKAAGVSQDAMNILAEEEFTDEQSLRGISFEQCRAMGIKGGSATILARLFGAQPQTDRAESPQKEVRFVSGRPEELKTPELVDRIAASLEKQEQPDPREVAELTRRLPGTAFIRNLETGLLDAAASKELQNAVGTGAYPSNWKGLPTEILAEVLKRKIFANPFTRAGIYDPTDQWLQVAILDRETVIYVLREKGQRLDEDNTLLQIQSQERSQRWTGWQNEWQALCQKTDAQSILRVARVRAELYLQEGGQPGSSVNPFSVELGIEEEIAPMSVASLTGEQQRQLREALLSAFPTRYDLEVMVSYGLHENLSSIAGDGALGHVVFTLIQWAQARGKVGTLISAALQQNGGNSQLRSIALVLRFVEQAPGKTDPVVENLAERMRGQSLSDQIYILMNDFMCKSGYRFSSAVLRNTHNLPLWRESQTLTRIFLLRTLPPQIRTHENLAIFCQIDECFGDFVGASDKQMDDCFHMNPRRYGSAGGSFVYDKWQAAFDEYRYNWEDRIS